MSRTTRGRSPLRRRTAIWRRRAERLPPAVRGLLWAVLSGWLFILLNTVMRTLAMQMSPFQVQFLRYAASLALLLPLVLRAGPSGWRPAYIGGHVVRGVLHAVGLTVWFIALPHVPMADQTALGFTGPIFVMLGAWLFLRERLRWDRWVAALLGFCGVLIVVAPGLGRGGNTYSFVMLMASPIFAASILLTKTLTRSDRPALIVFWQALIVTACSLPLAAWNWTTPTAMQWLGFAVAGLLGSGGQYCTTRALAVTDASGTQSLKFLDLIWSALMGWLVFSEVPTRTTLLGGAVISAATIWIARREARQRAAARG